MHPQSRIHKIFDTLGLRPYRTVFGRNCSRTVPSAVLTLGIRYGSLLVLYCTTAVNIQPYAIYGTARSPKCNAGSSSSMNGTMQAAAVMQHTSGKPLIYFLYFFMLSFTFFKKSMKK